MVKCGVDITGKRFGRCVAVQQVEDKISKSGKRYAQWECVCDCGRPFVTEYRCLMTGGTTSCGCYRRERMSKLGKTWRRDNEYDLSGEYGICYFHNEPDGYFIFDLDDYEKLSEYCWSKSSSNGYAYARVRGELRNITAQSVIMGQTPDGMVIDHINRDRLDNRKENLRFTSHKENARNRSLMSNNQSGFPGVHFQKSRQKWRASIAVDYQRIQLGEFDTKEEAYDAYLKAREKYWGDTYQQG